ncbi:MAG: transposase [Sphingomonadales bacterium]|nr:transposase [Sphingomonadales bacterium]
MTAKTLIELYARRWGIECSFRDAKDWRFGIALRFSPLLVTAINLMSKALAAPPSRHLADPR